MQLELFTSPSACRPAHSGRPKLAGYLPVYRVQLVRERTIPTVRQQFRQAQDVANLLWQYLDRVDREHFVVIPVDRRNRLIGIHTVSVGSLTASIAHMRETFKAAILSNAAAIVCGHNHTSGVAQPSAEDRRLTRRLVKAGHILGIELLDHVIIGDGSSDFYSFANHGELQLNQGETDYD